MSGELDLGEVIDEVRDVLVTESYSVQLPDYIAKGLWVSLIALRGAPELIRRSEGFGAGVKDSRGLPLSEDIVAVLEERFSSALEQSVGSKTVPVGISYDDLDKLARVLNVIGGTMAIEMGSYLFDVYEAFVHAGGEDDPALRDVIDDLKESRPFNPGGL